MACCDADGCGAEFDRFEGVFDLEEAAFWGESAVVEMLGIFEPRHMYCD